MIVLVANLGSTSFKYKLFDMGKGEAVLAQGAADRIGLADSAWTIEAGGKKSAGTAQLADHGAAIELHMGELIKAGVIASMKSVQAVGFKAVHGGPISGAVLVDDHVLDIQQQFADVAPAHNPPYIAAMKAFAVKLPGVPQVAAFETAFHQTIPASRTTFGIPHEWTEMGIRRYGFHGASHRYIATRMGELMPTAKKIISVHLGGSSSVCAIRDGKSVANSFGMTAQSGLPQAARVGDFDTFALLKLLKSGLDIDTIFKRMGKEGGIFGISGVSNDMRDIEKAAAQGNQRAQLALDVFAESVRDFIGSYLAVLNGADAICFTGGTGQFGREFRGRVMSGFDYAGIVIDAQKNMTVKGSEESRIDGAGSKTAVWVLPTNEELIVARQTVGVLEARNAELGTRN